MLKNMCKLTWNMKNIVENQDELEKKFTKMRKNKENWSKITEKKWKLT